MNKSLENKLEEFKKRWSNKCQEIKQEEFSPEQCKEIHIQFAEEELSFLKKINVDLDPEIEFELNKISNDLHLALESALSNYNKNKKGFLERINIKIDNFISLIKE